MKVTIEKLYSLFLKNPIIITDSREVKTGNLFFALKGPRFNANTYAKKAYEKGASYCIIDESQYQLNDRFILVDDVLETLQSLATYHRQQFDIPIIAITGSNGKTTTKELLSQVLSSHYKCHFTKGNLNNHIGVPLTLLKMPKETEIAIIEMGANHIDEINFLCQLANPTHGLITNVGRAHLEGFGNFEGVKKAKSELYKYLEIKDGTLFINSDEKYLVELAISNKQKIFYHQEESININRSDYKVKFINALPFVKASFVSENGQVWEINSQLIGQYNFNNIMTAIIIGRHFKVPTIKIKKSIENYLPSNNRSQLVELDSNTFVMDAYNANPTSMKKAIENFSKLPSPNKIYILGDMLELGKDSEKEHSFILDYVRSINYYNHLILVGAEFSKVLKKVNQKILHFNDSKKMKEWFDLQEIENTWILVKGSRGIRLEVLIN